MYYRGRYLIPVIILTYFVNQSATLYYPKRREMSLKTIPFETIELKSKDPMKLFQMWREEAAQLPNNDIPDAMTLETIRRKVGFKPTCSRIIFLDWLTKPWRRDGGPAARTVLLRGSDDKGYKIFTDYRSPKGLEIAADNRGALVFVWIFQKPNGEMGQRQVRIEGLIEKLSVKESQDYFNSEPIIAQIRTAVQNQSKVITDNREFLRVESQKILDMYNADPENFKVDMPKTWGGYRLIPNMMEFYQGTRDAFNDRIRFRKLDGQSIVADPGVSLGENNWFYVQLEP